MSNNEQFNEQLFAEINESEEASLSGGYSDQYAPRRFQNNVTEPNTFVVIYADESEVNDLF